MINLAQSERITRPFELNGKFYAFDSTTIDLCMSLFEWAYFKKTKSGLKVHTLFDVVTHIPTYIHITEARLHDVKAMDEIPDEPKAFYLFDKGCYDLARLYRMQSIGSMFIIRAKDDLKYEVVAAVSTYCLVSIVEHDCQLGRTTFNVLRVLSSVLTDKTSIRDLFKGSETIVNTDDETVKLQFEFKF